MPSNSFSAIKGECTQGFSSLFSRKEKQGKILGRRNWESLKTGKSENEGECSKCFLPRILDSESFGK